MGGATIDGESQLRFPAPFHGGCRVRPTARLYDRASSRPTGRAIFLDYVLAAAAALHHRGMVLPLTKPRAPRAIIKPPRWAEAFPRWLIDTGSNKGLRLGPELPPAPQEQPRTHGRQRPALAGILLVLNSPKPISISSSSFKEQEKCVISTPCCACAISMPR
jgi:hypothetical protein